MLFAAPRLVAELVVIAVLVLAAVTDALVLNEPMLAGDVAVTDEVTDGTAAAPAKLSSVTVVLGAATPMVALPGAAKFQPRLARRG